MQAKSLYATFIGINAYPQGALGGCVKDVLDIDLLLRDQCAQQAPGTVEYHPAYFLAPNATDLVRLGDHPAKINYDNPTFANITQKAFAHFDAARAGDICVLYYSGHGSQTAAPEDFSDRMMETLVCVDSRTNARDLVDKELAYLLWKAFSGKGVHALVVMDCCHSGNNTRSMKKLEDAVQFRFYPAGTGKVAFTEYLGYAEGFYTLKDGKLSFNIPPYVHFAACRGDEKAQETMSGGLFTSKLIEVLRAGGTASSYRNLMQNIAVTVRGRAERQSPVAFSQNDRDLDQQFLSSAIVPFKPVFEARYHARDKQWRLMGGAMHGILPSTVMWVGEKTEVPVSTVFPAYSILDEKAMQGFDTTATNIKALVLKRGQPAMKVKLATPIPHADSYPYFSITEEGAQYVAEEWEGGYILRGIDQQMPLFRREPDPAVFFSNVNKVGNWLAALELKNTDPALTAADLVFNWEVNGTPLTKQPGEDIVLPYVNDNYPTFRLNISLAPGSKITSCFVKALYLGSKYSIDGTLVRNDNNVLKPGGSIPLTFNYEGNTYDTIGVSIDEAYQYYGINEITDFLKIIVSNAEVNMDQYQQDSLPLDVPPTKRTRDLTPPGRAGKTVDQPLWSVFTFKLRCVGPKKEQVLRAGTVADFAAFTVEAPKGFSATARAITAEEQQGTRSIDTFGSVLTEETPFAPALHPMADSSIRMLELFPLDGSLEIKEGEPLIIRPTTATRSLDEEFIIPYAWDPRVEMYIPLGYTDDAGNVIIEQLPPPVTEAGTRSLGGSIKLFFKKLIRSKEANKLRIYERKNGNWEAVQTLQAGKAVLLIHGITGDTKYMEEVFRAKLDDKIKYLLTYDYENLSTSVKLTAEKLQAQLKGAGAANVELIIIAHSMGGLVVRWLTEQLKETDYIRKLILVGSPSAGSEMAALGVSAFAMLTQALNVTGPLKYAITGLSYLLKYLKLHPGETLNDLKPGSKVLTALAGSTIPTGVAYCIIGGDTSLLKDYTGDDTFLKKLKNNLLYPGLTQRLYEKEANDMAVTLTSMRAIPHLNGNGQEHVVPSNHLAYFQEKQCLQHILAQIQ